MDMPPMNAQEVCIVQAAAHYNAHPDIVRAVLRAEGGRVGQVRKNKDGSFDMGPMQINSVNLPELASYGITQNMLVNNECLNIHIGTYYLQKHIVTSSNYWNGVGKYHSKTPSKNTQYQYRVWGKLLQIRSEKAPAE